MANNQTQGADAAHIKPVSSLLSHFEGLKTPKPVQESNKAKESLGAKPVVERSTFPVRASLDLPRPDSPWNPTTDTGHPTPRTPGDPRKDRNSPTRSGHKRPMSMHIQSSPQLTPAVQIDSPKSPPRMLFARTASQSPERIDNTPFGKVRELISQHSSRSSTRPSSPGTEGERTGKKIENQETLHNAIAAAVPHRPRSPVRQPPPVNRADKPKIPAKPLTMMRTGNGDGRLTPEPRRPSVTQMTRVSPFSTPPSSEEGSPPPRSRNLQEVLPTPTTKSSGGTGVRRSSTDSNHGSKAEVSRSIDPRSMGFQPPPQAPERRDPRTLGFSHGNTMPPTIDSPTVIPTRANTVTEKPVSRDPRELGFGASRVAPRHVSENIRHSPSVTTAPVQTQSPVPARSGSIKDPRQFGFSSATASTPIREEMGPPELPTRRNVLAPPPRPSEDSKNTIRRPSKDYSPQRDTNRSINTAVNQVSRNPPTPISTHFPPPPKRNTFNEEDSSVPTSATGAAVPVESFRSYPEAADDSDGTEMGQDPLISKTDYPDTTQTNRRPPYCLSGAYEVHTRSDGKIFDVCGKYLCVSGYHTRVFDMSTGEQVLAISHGETVKVMAVKFKPGTGIDDEGQKLWLGNNIGDLQEVNIATHSITASSGVHNRREICRILRCQRTLWTLDEEGKLFVWKGDEAGAADLKYSHQSYKVQRGHTFSMVVRDKLWLATGREIRVYRPGNDAQFSVLNKPLSQPQCGDVTSGAYSSERGGRAYFGHIDGKVSIYSVSDYSCVGVVKASDYKINGLSFVGNKLWAAFKTGKVYVYDTSSMPWKVKKDWRAHEGPVNGLLLDPSSVWSLKRLQIVTAGHDNVARLWDATLEEDWMESAMHERDVQYCTFREVRAAVVSWNCGAASPSMLRNDFIADAIHSEDPPEIIAFGFQEVVDLEDRTVTAKSLLGFGKKKDAAKNEQSQSRVYREWRDYLARCIGRYTDAQYTYSEIHMSSLVGLFQCVFIRQEERRKISKISASNVKCGMGGHYGNKGALVTRFVLDDSSVCFVNCHLAAGQSHTSHRNNDVAAILESESLPTESDRQLRSFLYVGGGDGTQILDHEICIIHGDLNYRIDAIPRDTVVSMIKKNELSKLLERDQIMVCRRRVAGFRLASFTELPITFAPTYKYDPGTDNYDSSEKKRSPAWCDRLLYRGSGRIKQTEYRRHEVQVSDHRPISGMFKIRVKRVDHRIREKIRLECVQDFVSVKKEICEGVCVRWLVDVMGMREQDARNSLAVP